MRALTSESRWAALRSPVFWAALLVLAFNDHFLKRAGLLPPLVTGKLSDFAGLVVAPLTACAVFGARGRTARLSCFAAVVVPFVAIKLWPTAAHAVESLTRLVALDWRLWSDPTDLVALVSLPLAWRLDHARSRRVSHGRGTWLLERAGAVAASMACMATSDDYSIGSSLVLINATHAPVQVEVFRPPRPLNCDILAADPESAGGAAEFQRAWGGSRALVAAPRATHEHRVPPRSARWSHLA